MRLARFALKFILTAAISIIAGAIALGIAVGLQAGQAHTTGSTLLTVLGVLLIFGSPAVAGVLLWLQHRHLHRATGTGQTGSLLSTNVPEPIEPSSSSEFVVFDLETTGLHADRHEIIEIGAIRFQSEKNDYETLQILVRCASKVPEFITTLTGITNQMIERDGVPLSDAINAFREFTQDLPLVAYNAKFDRGFLHSACISIGAEPFKNEFRCALELARKAFPGMRSYRLTDLARDGGLDTDDEHRALGDCRRTLIIYCGAVDKLASTG